MSEKENNGQGQKVKTSKPAIASVSLGVLGVLVLALRVPVSDPWWSEYVARNIVGLCGIAGLILGIVALARIHKVITAITLLIALSSFLLFRFSGDKHIHTFLQACSIYASLGCLVGLLIAAAVLHWMSRSRRRFKGTALPILGVVLTTFLSVFWWAETCGPVCTAVPMKCAGNLIELGKAMRFYADEHQGQYPQPNQWCDLLLDHTDLQEKRFFCPGVRHQWSRQVLPWPVPRKAGCYYAMNPNCKPSSPSDMVLLFETKGGWNQFGGPEILKTENCIPGVCNILFNNGSVKFVGQKDLGKLKWKVEGPNTVK